MKTLFTAAELAGFFQVNKSTIYGWARDGILPSIRVRNSVRFDADAIQAFLDDGQTRPANGRPAPLSDAEILPGLGDDDGQVPRTVAEAMDDRAARRAHRRELLPGSLP